MKYVVEYLFKDQTVFKVEFEGEEWLPDRELEDVLEEQASIIRGQRVGINREVRVI